MLHININALEQYIQDICALLKDGLIATDVWDRESGLSLAAHKANPEAVALFGQLTQEIGNTLAGAGFPALGRYYLLELSDGNMVLTIQHGADLLQGMLLDAKKVNMGVLFSIAIPRSIDAIAKAR